MILVKRVYDPPSNTDGARFLVDKLWPRGLKKSDVKMKAWLKDVAPSTALRQWFHHEPEKWPEFRRRYLHEIKCHEESLKPLLEAAAAHDVTLLFSARDAEHNNAVALKEYLEKKAKQA